jgi:hypothetical protein
VIVDVVVEVTVVVVGHFVVRFVKDELVDVVVVVDVDVVVVVQVLVVDVTKTLTVSVRVVV